jgi:hypothetical protein
MKNGHSIRSKLYLTLPTYICACPALGNICANSTNTNIFLAYFPFASPAPEATALGRPKSGKSNCIWNSKGDRFSYHALAALGSIEMGNNGWKILDL